jgi:hypothetical protein
VQTTRDGEISTSDVPHTVADLIDEVRTLVRVAQWNERSSLSRQGRASLRRTALSTTNRGTDSSILTSLLELLTTTRTLRSGGRLVSTSTVGSQVCIVDGRDWEMSASLLAEESKYSHKETGVVERMY